MSLGYYAFFSTSALRKSARGCLGSRVNQLFECDSCLLRKPLGKRAMYDSLGPALHRADHQLQHCERRRQDVAAA